MSEVRVVDLKELGVSKETFDIIYSMGEEDGAADTIEKFIARARNCQDECPNLYLSRGCVECISEKLKEEK